MRRTCRVLPHVMADGPANMALDEALLDEAASAPGIAYFRTYQWREPTLSLGYFQSIAEADSDARWRGVPIVRRPTGGGAIFHEHEVTYALVLPTAHPGAGRGGTLYRKVHSAVAALFAARGAPVSRRGERSGPATDRRPFLCFADRDPEDLVLCGAKVVGSAQRRRAGAVLQHGSILLARSPRTPELPGAGDLAPVSTVAAAWSELLREHVPTALGFEPNLATIGPATLRRAADLERSVYRRDSWTRRR